MEENPSEEILYETRRHASGPYSPNYPPQQLNEGAKGGVLSLLPTGVIRKFLSFTQLTEKWSDYGQPKKLKRWVSLFVSPKGERVAVAVGNHISILRKDDDYQVIYGSFTGLSTFTHGVWSESHDVLGTVDESDTLYFCKANGEEIIRIERRHLKVSCPILGLLVPDDADEEGSFLCSFDFLTSDGSLHHIEISQDLSASISSIRTWTNAGKQFLRNVFCFDYDPEHSLLVLVGSAGGVPLGTCSSTGSCSLSLWHWSRNSDLQPVISTNFEGLYMRTKGYTGLMTFPKVLISPEAKFIAALDSRACLNIFKLDKARCSLSIFFSGEICNSKMTNNSSSIERKSLDEIVDFTWWSDHILTLARKGGTVIMYDVINGKMFLDNCPVFSLPILERVQQFQGEVFLLDSSLPEGIKSFADHMEIVNLYDVGRVTREKFDMSRFQWSLSSFSKRSVPEMYDALINNMNYQSAFEFANRHKLDKDRVLKSQWLHSEQGTHDINMYLSNMKDKTFILGECVERVGPTEDAVKALLAFGLHLTDRNHFSVSDYKNLDIWDFLIFRLKLLQFKDRLETFLGINMGRFSVQEYSKFRVMPINETAIKLAENGKIGALNLLFKQHPYSLYPFMLEVLSAIPETVPVQTYGQLLPGRSPPSNIALRGQDWIECEEMVKFIRDLAANHESDAFITTEPIAKQIMGLSWPPTDEISEWYKNRARDIDKFTGQLENSFCLVDFACCKGIDQLQQFYEDISYLQQLIYSGISGNELDFSISLAEWECLSDYEKFRAMLKDATKENVIDRLGDKAILFMQNRSEDTPSSSDGEYQIADSFLVRWMKEIAEQNNIEICLVVIEEGCRDMCRGFFRNEMEAVDCALHCIYLCSATDRWNTMASIVSKLPHIQGTDSVEGLEGRVKLAEDHIEAGRLLALYQVPKPMRFFLESQDDEKGVKQILRLMLSKFIRRQPSRSDNDWVNMWRDLQCLQEKAFPFVDLEYLLMEFCRGLLKAGKFSLARNYLKEAGAVSLPAEKAENLVIQTAREYFFSASSLACSEIWNAKECLNLFPSSRSVRAEADIIDALTVKLPKHGIHLLPMQYKQIKDPMEIIKMAITSQAGAYLNVDELLEIARLLGLNSQGDVASIQEAIAREAAVAGDLQLAFDLCLALGRKGHGPIWDLCAAIARGPVIENMTVISRMQLLGFALCHCDDESIGDMLHAWKDLDMQSQSELLMMLTATSPNFMVEGSSVNPSPGHSSQCGVTLRDCPGIVDGFVEPDNETPISKIKSKLCEVARDLPIEIETSWDNLLRENGKVLSFAALFLPWLVELSGKSELGKKFFPDSVPQKYYVSVRTQALLSILSWLTRCGFAPRDDLIASLAKSVMEPPVTEEEDILGCSFLLNLMDAFHGVEIIEEQLKTRENYKEICSIMNVGMTYSLLHNSEHELKDPIQRRELLLRAFMEKISPDELEKIDKTQSTFWMEWKLKLEEQKRVADRVRMLEQLIPGVETTRFLLGDLTYIRSVIFSFIESVKSEKKHILKDVLKLAESHSLNPSEVLIKFLSSVLVSEAWTNDEITSEILEVKGDILASAAETIKTITCVVYPAIDGCNKTRLAYIYGLLSDCYMQLQETSDMQPSIHQNPAYLSLGFPHFYRVLEQECNRVSFIKDLNFKNIADIGALNYEHFIQEVCDHIDEFSVEALANTVQTLVSTHTDPAMENLISWQDVYRIHVLNLFKNLVNTANHVENPASFQSLLNELEKTYDICRKHIILLENQDALDIMKQYFKIIPMHASSMSVSNDLTWKDCLLVLLNFWVRLAEDMQGIASEEKLDMDCLTTFLKFFLRLVVEGKVTPSQGWGVVYGCADYSFLGTSAEIFYFCRAMVLSGCRFDATEAVFSEVVLLCAGDQNQGMAYIEEMKSLQDVSELYVYILESILQGLLHENSERQDLNNMLSSLSSSEGDSQTLKRVRHAVWERLAKFSDNLQLPSHIRVYVLEVMQFILGRNINGPTEQDYDIQPWEDWDEWHYTSDNHEFNADSGQSDPSSRFKSTLVALKSTKLASVISTSLEITPDDLFTVNSAVSRFSMLCGSASMDSDFDALLAILREWESLFVEERTEEGSPQASDAGLNWSDDWDDDNWESFEPFVKEKRTFPLPTHPLHSCWMEIIGKLVTLLRFSDALKLIDQSLGKPNWVLINEDEARSLSNKMLESDCFMALKMALLLPYEAIQLHCLVAVDGKLRQEGITDARRNDRDFLIVVLSSGVVATIVRKSSSFGATFSYLSYLVGNFLHRCQDAELSRLNRGEKGACGNDDEEFFLLFRRILFPCFVSELVKVDQQILAGFLVMKFMHTHAALSLINVAEASLHRYLKMMLQVLPGESSVADEVKASEVFGNTLSSLTGKLKGFVHSALSSLPSISS